MFNLPINNMLEKKLLSSKSKHKKILKTLRIKKLELKMKSNILKRKKNNTKK